MEPFIPYFVNQARERKRISSNKRMVHCVKYTTHRSPREIAEVCSVGPPMATVQCQKAGASCYSRTMKCPQVVQFCPISLAEQSAVKTVATQQVQSLKSTGIEVIYVALLVGASFQCPERLNL